MGSDDRSRAISKAGGKCEEAAVTYANKVPVNPIFWSVYRVNANVDAKLLPLSNDRNTDLKFSLYNDFESWSNSNLSETKKRRHYSFKGCRELDPRLIGTNSELARDPQHGSHCVPGHDCTYDVDVYAVAKGRSVFRK